MHCSCVDTSATGPAAHGAGELDSKLMTRPALTLGSPLVSPGFPHCPAWVGGSAAARYGKPRHGGPTKPFPKRAKPH
jgi:hypothetical protein